MSLGSEHCRVLPIESTLGAFERFEFIRHLFAYTEVDTFIKGAKILELGSGEGYGSRYLSRHQKEITAVDIMKHSPNVGEFNGDNIFYCQACGTEFPFRGEQFDAVVSFQVIEHIQNVNRSLEEIFRVLKPGGLYILTTPNRKLRLYPFERPRNPWHVHEYYGKELKDLLQKYFSNVLLLGVMSRSDLMEAEKRRFKPSICQLFFRSIQPLTHRLISKQKRNCLNQKYFINNNFTNNDQRYEITLSDFFLSPDFNNSLDFFVCAKK